MNSFVSSLQAEWLKSRRTAGSWLVIIGGFFIPAISLLIAFSRSDKLTGFYRSADFWENKFLNDWQSMALFLLPMGVILASSLLTQVEYRNNTWKLVHALPQRFAVVYFSKLTILLLMMLQFFVLFNIGVYVSALIPAMIYDHVPFPTDVYPFLNFMKINLRFYIDCLPIVAVQYLISLHFKNFMVPIGAGLAMVIASMFAVQWEYGYTVPYTYTSFYYLSLLGNGKLAIDLSVHYLSLIYFVGITALGFVLYRTKKEIG